MGHISITTLCNGIPWAYAELITDASSPSPAPEVAQAEAKRSSPSTSNYSGSSITAIVAPPLDSYRPEEVDMKG